MQVIEDLTKLENGWVEIEGESFPILEVMLMKSQQEGWSKVKLNWKAILMTEYSLQIQLEFENPIDISQNIEPDWLEIVFKCPYFFVSTDSQALAEK